MKNVPSQPPMSSWQISRGSSTGRAGPSVEDGLDGYELSIKKLRTGVDYSLPIPPRQEAQVSDSEEHHEASSRKKRKPRKSAITAKGKGKRKPRVRLRALFDKLPTEIVYMISDYLHPLDLLRLARTSRMLRSHLMSKSSASVWRKARQKVDPPVPDCPPDQSEPQWAYLLFSTDCTVCIQSGDSHSDFWKLEFATSTFFCTSRSNYNGLLICGPEDMDSHRCDTFPALEPIHECLSYDHWASSAVAALIAAANLHPDTTAEQMDRLDLRFYCPAQQSCIENQNADVISSSNLGSTYEGVLPAATCFMAALFPFKFLAGFFSGRYRADQGEGKG